MIDRRLGFNCTARRWSVTEAYQDDRHARRLGGLHIDVAVSHHESARDVAACEVYDAGKMAGIRFCHGEGVAACDRREITFEIKLLQEEPAQALSLVGAHREPRSLVRQT